MKKLTDKKFRLRGGQAVTLIMSVRPDKSMLEKQFYSRLTFKLWKVEKVG